MSFTIGLSSGGTGGHVFPALSLAHALSQRDHEVCLFTDQRGLRYVPEVPPCPVIPLSIPSVQKRGVQNVKQILGITKETYRMSQLFASHRPHLVIGFGGYPSMPVLAAAWMKGIPLMLHEQNSVLGRVNRGFSRVCRQLCLGFPQTQKIAPHVPTTLVGNPLAPQWDQHTPTRPIFTDTLRVAVIGGSQGTSLFSSIVPEALASIGIRHRVKIEVCHQAREKECANTHFLYAQKNINAVVKPFFSDMPALYDWCHLAICRAGAMTVCELQAAQRPALFIPLAIATEDHQFLNALASVNQGGGWILREQEATSQGLVHQLDRILSPPHPFDTFFHQMGQHRGESATVMLANVVEDLLRKEKT